MPSSLWNHGDTLDAAGLEQVVLFLTFVAQGASTARCIRGP
jgi:hypothetical protein